MAESEWDGLNFIGPKLAESVVKLYGCASAFANSFDTVEDAEAVFCQLACSVGMDVQHLKDEAARRLVEWSASQQGAFKRRRRSAASELEYSLFAKSAVANVEPTEVFESIIKDDPKYALEVAKRVSKQRKSTGTNRADLEEALRQKFAMELASIINEACLPVVNQISLLDDPDKAWLRVFGARRGKTLRNRARSWNRFRMWLVAYSGAVWPKTIADLINYVEECIQVGCALTIHTELQASLVLLERAGRVPECRQLSMDPTWKAHLQSWSQELSSNSRPRGSAPPYTVSILIALELLVMDIQRDYYAGVIAWCMLVATWGCMRVDDIQCIMPETMKLSPRGFSVRMSKTKTTGPGKCHGQVHAFIHRSITLTGHDWVEEDMQLFRHETAVFPRDYLVPSPTEGWHAMRKKLVEPPQLANYFRMVLQMLGTPKYEDGKWRVNPNMELVSVEMSLFWKGHSPRHFLPQVSAAIGCDRHDRDFLGRWAIGRVGSNAYLHTSRQITERIQQQVLSSLHGGDGAFDETELLDSVREFAEKAELSGQRVRRRHKTLPLPKAEDMMRHGYEEESEDDLSEHGADEDRLREEHVGDDADAEGSVYFITVSRRTGFRRLHVTGKCHVHAERCQQTEAVVSPTNTSFDAICRVCKKYLKDQGDAESRPCCIIQIQRHLKPHSVSDSEAVRAMAVDDAARRAYIAEHVSSDLQYIWQATQYSLSQHYKTMKVFSSMCDTKAEVREALRTDFRIDPAASPETRADVAKVLTSWELSKSMTAKEQELQAETKVLGMPRVLQHTERQAMVKAVEVVLGKLQDSEIPSNEFLAMKVEEADTSTSALQTSLDSAGHVRVTKVKTKGRLPDDTESLRKALKLEAVSWLCMAAKFRNKTWLHGLQLQHWTKYTEYLLGEKVLGLKFNVERQTHAVRPPWAVILSYEQKMRKEVFKWVQAGTHTIAEGLTAVIRDAELKEAHYTAPIALGVGWNNQKANPNPQHPNKWQRTSPKGKGQSKGFKGGKGKNKSGKNNNRDFNGNSLVTHTPDGRELGFAFNAQGCSGKCGRVHACRVRGCYAKHSAREHHKYANGKPPQKGDGKVSGDE
eukprot:s3778_g9.t1